MMSYERREAIFQDRDDPASFLCEVGRTGSGSRCSGRECDRRCAVTLPYPVCDGESEGLEPPQSRMAHAARRRLVGGIRSTGHRGRRCSVLVAEGGPLRGLAPSRGFATPSCPRPRHRRERGAVHGESETQHRGCDDRSCAAPVGEARHGDCRRGGMTRSPLKSPA